MGNGLRRATSLLVALALPALAAAAPRISLAPVRGDARAVLKRQLASTLCRHFECVPISRLRRAGRLDFAKVEAQRVAGVVAGTVVRKKGGRQLELALLTTSHVPAWTRSYPLTRKGTLSGDSALDLRDELDARLGAAAPAPAAPPPPPPAVRAPALEIPPAAPAPPPPAVAEAPPVAAPPEAKAEPPPEAPLQPVAPPQPVSPPAAETPAPVPSRATAPRGEESEARLVVAAEAGTDLVQRKLSYDGVPAGNTALRGFQANTIASPRFHAELYPVSLLAGGVLAGFGLFADYGFSVGLKTDDPAGGAAHPANLTRLGGGLLWRLRPVSSSQFALIPAVSYQHLRFTVGGTSIPGLPDADLSGVKASLDAGIPIAGAVSVLLGFGYVKWTTARDLVGDGFFPSGKAYALEAEAGVSVALGERFSLRLLGEGSSTRYSLSSSPGGTYQATGATDQYLGGRAMLRAEF